MKTINKQISFFVTLAEVFSKISNTFDRHLLGGLSFNNFIIMYHLSQAQDEMMRRIDLADKVGVTPSGITRMLLPMEKLGMLTRVADERDARVSYVKLAPGGKRLLNETIDEANDTAEEMLSTTKLSDTKDLNDIFKMFSI